MSSREPGVPLGGEHGRESRNVEARKTEVAGTVVLGGALEE